MLYLTRKKGQQIKIGGDIVIEITDLRPGEVRIGIQAPPELKIDRAGKVAKDDNFGNK